MEVGWVIQRNFDDEPKQTKEMVRWCKENDIKYQLVDYVPFSGKLPEIKIGKPIFYGGTGLIRNAIKEGYDMFYDKDNFTMSAGYAADKDMFVNNGTVTTVSVMNKWEAESPLFIRPDEDLKIFSGEVFYNPLDLSRVFAHARASGLLNGRTKVVYSRPLDIYREWRCVVVDKEVVSISHYNTSGKLDVSRELSPTMWEIANHYAKRWTPSKLCVMDIASTKPVPRKSEDCVHLYDGCDIESIEGVLEFNCFHGSGWYDNDIDAVMEAVTEAFKREFVNE